MSSIVDPEILEMLRGIEDPEVGISIVDLGLVYRAIKLIDRLDVAITLTTPSCPLGENLVEEVRAALERSFPNGPPVSVELVWDPPWTPDRMTETARRQLS